MIFPVVDTNLIIISPCKVSFDVGLELCVGYLLYPCSFCFFMFITFSWQSWKAFLLKINPSLTIIKLSYSELILM